MRTLSTYRFIMAVLSCSALLSFASTVPSRAATEASFTDPGVVQIVSGEHARDYVGRSVASAGDVNGDGYNDVIVGAPELNDEYGGTAYLIFGTADGITSTSVSDGHALQITGSTEQYGDAGYAVASAGDMNGDGYDDLVIGAPNTENAIGDVTGFAYIIYGAASLSSVSLDTAVRLEGEHADDDAGQSVASAGDVNGDGYDDVIIGAYSNDLPGDDNDEGAAYLIYGSDTKLTSRSLSDVIKFTGVGRDFAGSSVASAGDVNGDGYDDMLVGAYGSDTVYLIYGSASALTGGSLGDTTIITGPTASYLGYQLAAAGDLNDDGYDDIALGASRDDAHGSYTGAVFVIYGSPTLPSAISTDDTIQLTGDRAGLMLGRSVASAGDVNGDGFADLAVSFLNHVSIVFGSATTITAGSFTADIVLSDDTDGATNYFAIASADDLNGDGFSELIIGNLDYDAVESSVGTAYIADLYALAGDASWGVRTLADIVPAEAGAYMIRYTNGSSDTKTLFADDPGVLKIKKLKNRGDDPRWVALRSDAKVIAALDNTGAVYQTLKLSKKAYPINTLQTSKLHKKPAVIVSMKKSGKKQSAVAVVQLKSADKDSDTLLGKKAIRLFKKTALQTTKKVSIESTEKKIIQRLIVHTKTMSKQLLFNSRDWKFVD